MKLFRKITGDISNNQCLGKDIIKTPSVLIEGRKLTTVAGKYSDLT
jgi:hypothetical protein